jgi:hypothetical protein
MVPALCNLLRARLARRLKRDPIPSARKDNAGYS